jgi:hypothetical protein
MISVVGLLLGAVGWLDIVMLWLPAHIGRAEWEFGTISATFDALPLATLGLGLLLAGSLAAGWMGRIKALGWFALGVLVLLLAVLVLYGLDVPLAWKGVAPAALPMLKRAMAKTLALALAYLVVYGLFGWIARRRVREALNTPLVQGV